MKSLKEIAKWMLFTAGFIIALVHFIICKIFNIEYKPLSSRSTYNIFKYSLITTGLIVICVSILNI